MIRILITGSPGVGKSTVSKFLEKKLGIPRIDMAELAIKKGFTIRYIEELKTFEVDVQKLRSELESILVNMKNFILDGHLIEAVPEYLIDYVFVLRLHPKILEVRLKKKGYPEAKIRENLLSEILDSCLITALNYFGEERVHEIDTTNKSVEEIANEILDVVYLRKRPVHGVVDWISRLEEEGLLDKYLKQ